MPKSSRVLIKLCELSRGTRKPAIIRRSTQTFLLATPSVFARKPSLTHSSSPICQHCTSGGHFAVTSSTPTRSFNPHGL